MQDYINKMRKLTDEELIEIFHQSGKFVSQAVEAAFIVSVERGISGHIHEFADDNEDEALSHTEQGWQQEPQYVQGTKGLVFSFKSSERCIGRFEEILCLQNIPYFKEETSGHPSFVCYYVCEEDYPKTEKIYYKLKANVKLPDMNGRSTQERKVLVLLWFIFVIALIVFLIPVLQQLFYNMNA